MYVNVYFRATLDLMKLDKDHTHDITVNLVDQVGRLRMLVTITGAVSSTDHEVSPTMRDEITRRYVSTPQLTYLVLDTTGYDSKHFSSLILAVVGITGGLCVMFVCLLFLLCILLPI